MKLWGRVFAAAFAAAFLLSATGCEFIQKLKARDRLNKGVRAYEDKRFEEAAQYFSEAKELDPELLNAYLYLATTYSSMFVPGLPKDSREYQKNMEVAERAISTFQEVLAKEPKRIDAMVSIAAIYDQLEEFDKAKEWCRKILDVDPKNHEALYRIGVINWKISFKQTGLQGEGVASLKDQEKEELLKLIDEGQKVLSEAIEINPNYFEAMSYLNLMFREQAKFVKDEDRKRELLQQADRYAAMALELERKAKEEEVKKGKKKIA